jgi:GDP-4-dehydro-6-deoxy-D-mannose reductase
MRISRDVGTRALVTGSRGFVGGYLVGELAGAGYEVVETDILAASAVEPGAGPSRGSVSYERCDLRDARAVRELVARCAPRVIFHLAAQSSAAASLADPRGTLEANVFGALSIFEAARGGATRIRILSVGSSEEYGVRSPDEMPLTETSRIEPASPYAVSKAAQSMLARQYVAAFGCDAVVTRSFSHTGPGQTERFVLPAFAKQCAEIKAGLAAPVVRVGNLAVTRDFTDVRDIARAYRLLAEAGEAGQVYNVCSGRGLKLSDALDYFIGRSGTPIAVERDPRLMRPADIPVLIGDPSRLRSRCGWEPAIGTERMLGDLFDYWDARVAARGSD